MKLNTIQNRRDFFKCSITRGIKYLGSITAIIVSEQNLLSNLKNKCLVNIPCGNCYKMGICEKDDAEKARMKVKRDSQIAKIPKGISNV